MHDCWTGLTAVVEYGWIGALGANCRGVGELETASVFIGDASGMISSSGSSTRVVSGELCPNLEGSDEGANDSLSRLQFRPARTSSQWSPLQRGRLTGVAGVNDPPLRGY